MLCLQARDFRVIHRQEMPKSDAVSSLHPGAGSWCTNTLLARPPVEQLGVTVYTASGGAPGGRASVAHHGKLLITHTELASQPCVISPPAFPGISPQINDLPPRPCPRVFLWSSSA